VAQQGRRRGGGAVRCGRLVPVLADEASACRPRGDRRLLATRYCHTQQDLDLRFETPVVAGNRVTVEWWAVMRDPGWRTDASTDAVTLPGCLMLRFTDGGLCGELREYYNPTFGTASAPPPGWGQ